MFQKPDYIKVLKIAAGAGMAMALAEGLGLNYAASAGVITLLSIQDTKKETIRVMVRRLFSFGLALAFSFACFSVFGYGALALGVFLLFFSGVSLMLHIPEGISVNTVLMTHFMAEQSMSFPNIANELALLTVGAGLGVLLNLYIPGKAEQIRVKQREIESRIRGILDRMADMLSLLPRECAAQGTCSSIEWSEKLGNSLKELESKLKEGEKNAYEEMENKLLTETKYYLRYMNMRWNQSGVLGRIAENIGHLRMLPVQSEQIARFIRQISASFHEYNNALSLLAELERVKEAMRTQPLPDTREEFESRAVLYRILLELEQFLEIKKQFVEELTEDEIEKFWGNEGRLS